MGGRSKHFPLFFIAAHPANAGYEKSKTLQESRRRACLTADRGGGWGAGGAAAALKVIWIFVEIGSDFVQYFQPHSNVPRISENARHVKENFPRIFGRNQRKAIIFAKYFKHKPKSDSILTNQIND